MSLFAVPIAKEQGLLIAVMGIVRRTMNDRLRVRDGLRGRRQVIELTPATYREIWNALVESGYDWLVFPDLGQIPMDGFVVRSADRGRQ